MLKAGILGGGQLGRMLLQAAANYPVETYVLEKDPQCPAAHLCHHFFAGDITEYDDVYAFGKDLDVMTIEIERVNVDALQKLEDEGVRIYPKPAVLRTIQNKIRQKAFYAEHGIPSPPFLITQSLSELSNHTDFLPAAHKLAEGGYDGRGVQLLRKREDLDKGFDAPAILESMVEVQKELAQIAVVDTEGRVAMYPPVEMIFDPVLNQLDYQLAPAEIEEKTLWKVEAIVSQLVRAFDSPGLFAVELFVDRAGDVWVNETAPRVHNSGHHTIEAHFSSQFDQVWRVMLGYPLGNTDAILPSAMINVVGAEGESGDVHYEGLDELLRTENAFVHLYGKRETKPGRKMGHVTLMGGNRGDLAYGANRIKQLLRVGKDQP